LRLAAKIIITAIASLMVIGILIVGLIWAALFEPWPLSRRQGPDTDFAKSMYRRLVGSEAPQGVRDLYARDEWGFGGDSIYSLRFRFEDPEIAAMIAANAGWERVRPEDLGRLRYLAAPSKWWPTEKRMRGLAEAYHRRSIEALWIDRANHTAYLQVANFCCVLAPPPPVP
jgi:hypothetical protein